MQPLSSKADSHDVNKSVAVVRPQPDCGDLQPASFAPCSRLQSYSWQPVAHCYNIGLDDGSDEGGDGGDVIMLIDDDDDDDDDDGDDGGDGW